MKTRSVGKGDISDRAERGPAFTLLYSFGANAAVGVEIEGLPAVAPPLTEFVEYFRIVSKPATNKMLANAVVRIKETMLARNPRRIFAGRWGLARPPLPCCTTRRSFQTHPSKLTECRRPVRWLSTQAHRIQDDASTVIPR